MFNRYQLKFKLQYRIQIKKGIIEPLTRVTPDPPVSGGPCKY